MSDRFVEPWPGPRPYEEQEWPLFFGRKREVVDVADRLLSQRLTVLSGESGVGKTSLLRAGIVARLRLRRYRAKAATWPVLVFREWAGSLETFQTLVRFQVQKAAEALKWWRVENVLAEDDSRLIVEALQSCEEEVGLLEVFRRLVSYSDGVNGLFLVFDQVEEIIRLGQSVARETSRFLAELYQSGLPIRILISLRQEQLADLRHLESIVGGLIRQTIFLGPMEGSAAKQAIGDAAAASGIEFPQDEDVIGYVLSLLREGDAEAESVESVDLLSLQALLHDFFEEHLRRKIEVGVFLCTKGDVQSYLGEVFGSSYSGDGRSVDGKGEEAREGRESLAGRVLKRWIERALRRAKGAGEEDFARFSQDQLNALVRRELIRLAPQLSSGSYKVSQEEVDLLRKTLAADIRILTGRSSEQTKRIRLISRNPPRLDRVALGISDIRDKSEIGRLSGLSFERKWSPAATADLLASAFFVGMNRLAQGNIIKSVIVSRGGGGEEIRWELVHDGLGKYFAEWADDRRDDWEDCVNSLVAGKGITPITIRQSDLKNIDGMSIPYVRWEGCLISPEGPEVTINGATFRHCALRGSIFERIIFVGCVFYKCDLAGAIFRDCKFLPNEQGVQSKFVKCYPESMALIDSQVYGLEFCNCRLRQLTFRNVHFFSGPVFSKCRITLSNFRGLDGEFSAVFQSDCVVSYCSGDDRSWRLLNFECKTFRCKVIRAAQGGLTHGRQGK